MASKSPLSKVDAIYELRDAVEAKAQPERALEDEGTPAARDALLAAQLDVEAKTQDAIDVCHECGEHHHAGQSHVVRESADNVVRVDFGRESGSA